MINLLISSGADINARDKKGETPLLCAIKKRNFNTAVYLILSGADVNIGDKERNTPLSLAEQSKNKALVRLLKKYGAK